MRAVCNCSSTATFKPLLREQEFDIAAPPRGGNRHVEERLREFSRGRRRRAGGHLHPRARRPAYRPASGCAHRGSERCAKDEAATRRLFESRFRFLNRGIACRSSARSAASSVTARAEWNAQDAIASNNTAVHRRFICVLRDDDGGRAISNACACRCASSSVPIFAAKPSSSGSRAVARASRASATLCK